jgi:pimeloyl-ACP methyl ester carboxylesterase
LSAVDDIRRWEERGRFLDVDGRRVFTVDVPAGAHVGNDPLLVLHGFPTCSYEWRHVLDALSAERRVVLFDFLGFGLSDKPDERYSIRGYADTAEAVAKEFGLSRIALLTHDMGDTVGGELLARGTLEVTRRVVTNGSIYIDMAQLTPGQQLLLSLPDERLEGVGGDEGDTGTGYRHGLGSTFSSQHPASAEELEAQWLLMSTHDGNALLPRTIRYIEDRRAEERRFTGAIETHPSPLGVVWGDQDPVAVHPMTAKLLEARPDATLITLDGVGHYPMVETPDRFAKAVLSLL